MRSDIRLHLFSDTEVILSYRYEGAVNRITDVKECAFWGSKYIVGASDGGAVFVWRRSDCKPHH